MIELNLSFPAEEVNEGTSRFLIPTMREVKNGTYIPRELPVFFNQDMKFSRDISVTVVDHLFQRRRDVKICDAMAGSGATGLRLVNETGVVREAVLNDLNVEANRLLWANLKYCDPEVKVEIANRDANALLSSANETYGGFDYIDLDPAGTPAPFLENAIRAARANGVIGVTATDLAPLCGVHVDACIRKYSAKSIRCPFSREVALRILLGFAARTAARLGIAVEPVLSYVKGHYARLFLRVKKSATEARQRIDSLGFIGFCPGCLAVYEQRGLFYSGVESCEKCSSRVLSAGPLWLDSNIDRETLVDMINSVCTDLNPAIGNVLKLLELLVSESTMPPFYYSVTELGKRLRCRACSPKLLVTRLRSLGFKSSLTHFDTSGIKANSQESEIKSSLLALS